MNDESTQPGAETPPPPPIVEATDNHVHEAPETPQQPQQPQVVAQSKNSPENIKERLRFPIALKLVGITVTLLLCVTALIAIQSSEYFEKEVRETHEQSNQLQAASRATEVENILQSYIDKIRIVSSLLYKIYPTPMEKEDALNLSFKPDKDFVSVEVFRLENGQAVSVDRAVNPEYLQTYGLTLEYISQVRKLKPFPVNAVFAGNIEIMNSSIPKGAPLLTVGIPFVKDQFERVSHIAVADIRLDRIQKAFVSTGAAEIFLVDSSGVVLAHPDDKLAFQGASLKQNPAVAEAITSKLRSNHLPSFNNPDDGRDYYGVFNKTPFGVSVVAQIPEEVILEPARLVQRRAFYVGGLVLSAALFLVFLFSVTLTSPIEQLADITVEVSKGNYSVDTKNIKSKDEVGFLASAFEDMIQGLRERAKAYAVMNQALGASVIETLMNMKDEELGGQRKPVAVLFSDLRDFTKFSEGHSPEEVVVMLNEYFDVMVRIIGKYGGWLDKFIGDAIMAVWGVPYTGENDEARATMAALEMRVALLELNELRKSRGQHPIKIGVGLHCGDAIVGKIGAVERSNLTVIGDTVNQASRIEASTKAFGTDLLLSQEMVDRVKEFFVLEYAGSAEVKGKAEPLKMYKVRGYFDEEGQPVIVQTPYSDYKAESVDKIKVA